MSIKDWPKADRPSEKLFQHGPGVLSDTELLAILLMTGSSKQGLTAMDCARFLLKKYSNLRKIGNVSGRELLLTPGIGPGKASRVHAAFEIANRIVGQTRDRGRIFQTSRDIFETYSVMLRDKNQEMFLVLLLDSKNRLLRDERISLGSLNYSVVHPREVFNPAVRESAASVILMHNLCRALHKLCYVKFRVM